MCKLYPVQIGGVVDLTRGKNEIKYSICPNDEFDPVLLTGKNIEVKEFVKMMHEKYGDSYMALLERDFALKETTDWLKALISQGKINPAKPNLNPKEVLRMVEASEKIPLTDYIKRNTGIEVGSFIMHAKGCAHGKLMIKNIKEKEISKR